MIDVLVPAYNAEKYIDKTIKSIVKQTYEDWRLIIINDGSTDDTESIVEKWKDKDGRIAYYNQKNQGTVETRKRLMKYVRGDYFTFIDADDEIHPQMLIILYNIAIKSKADIVMIKDLKNMSSKLEIGKSRHRINTIPNYTKINNIEFMENFLEYPNFNVGVIGKLFTKEIAESEISVPQGIFVGDDACFNLEVAKVAKKIVMINESLYFYRSNGGSSKYYKRLADDIVKFHEFRANYIKENKLNESLIKRSLNNVLHIYRSLSGNSEINAENDYKVLKLLIDEYDWEKCSNDDLKNFYETLSGGVSFVAPKEKENWVIRFKQLVLKYL